MTGGRFNDNGNRILREADKAQALEWLGRSIDRKKTVLTHPGIHSTWAQDWALHSPLQSTKDMPAPGSAGDARYYAGDMQFMDANEQRKLAGTFHVVAVGPYFLVDRASAKAPAEGYSFDEREPNLLEWYFSAGVDPVRSIRPDPWYTWELREHYGQTPNPPPKGAPQSLDEIRVAHNIAVAAGDASLAAKYRERLLEKLRTSIESPFTDGTRLLGEKISSGVAPTLTLYFLSTGSYAADWEFRIDSTLRRKRPLSLVSRDGVVRRVDAPFAIPTRLWKKDFIYSVRTELRQRPGPERFTGHFSGQPGEPPKLAAGAAEVDLLELP
jgi:hypothetical protein